MSATSRESIQVFLEDYIEHDCVRHKTFSFKVKHNPPEWQQAVFTIIHGLENFREGEVLEPAKMEPNGSIVQMLNQF